MIDFTTEDITYSLDESNKIINWIENVVNTDNKILGDICFIFCSDDYLLNVNQKYLKHNYFTDVITFDYSADSIISGDIFISIDRVKDNSTIYKSSFQQELLRILIHGVLHLLGYDDKLPEDKSLMTSKEDYYLKRYRNVE